MALRLPPSLSENRTQKAILAFLGIAAVLPRFWALDWGLPLRHAHIDESVVLFYALRVVAGDPNPQVFFDYPGLFLYVLAALFQVVLLGARLAGAVPDAASALAAYTRGGLDLFTPAARVLNAGLGVATVFWVYWMGRRRGGFYTGVTAGLLLAVNRLHVLHSHYATVDVAAALLSLLALDRILDFWETSEFRTGAWAAFLVGLAA